VEVSISYHTALKADQTIRCAIAQQELKSRASDRSEPEAFFFRCRGVAPAARRATSDTPVFGVTEHNGKVQTTVVNHLTVSELFDSDLKVVKRGSILCTDRYNDYDALLLSRPKRLSIEHVHRLAPGRIHVDRLEGFWSFAKTRLFKSRAMVNWNLPLYLKELQFRYNHRAEPLFELLVDRVVGLVPNFLSSM
jgi:transposase